MALKTIVKVSNVTNLSDARYCAGMGVDMLGFAMDETSEQYIAPEKVTEIRGWVAGVRVVGETASNDPADIETLLERYEPDMIQVEEATLLPFAASLGLPAILKLDLALLTTEQLEAFLTSPPAGMEYVLLESKASLNLDDELRKALQRLAGIYPVLLGTGITAENVYDLLADIPVRGIALTGGSEDRPGFRDFGELMDVLEALEED